MHSRPLQLAMYADTVDCAKPPWLDVAEHTPTSIGSAIAASAGSAAPARAATAAAATASGWPAPAAPHQLRIRCVDSLRHSREYRSVATFRRTSMRPPASAAYRWHTYRDSAIVRFEWVATARGGFDGSIEAGSRPVRDLDVRLRGTSRPRGCGSRSGARGSGLAAFWVPSATAGGADPRRYLLACTSGCT